MKKAIELSEHTVPPDEPAVSPAHPEYVLNIVGVCQDNITREWAAESFERAAQLAGEERIQNTWYDASSLSDPGTFVEAVSTALVADVIVVSIYAVEELPLDLYVWFDAWLPRRLSRAGALAAIVGAAGPSEPQSLRTFDYLQAVARKAQLDFIPDERLRSAALCPASMPRHTKQADFTGQLLMDLPGLSSDGHHQSRLRE